MSRFRRIPPRTIHADHRTGRRGFTLIEITIVLLIIGILAAMAIFSYRMMISKARMTQAKTVLGHLTKTEATYFSDHERYTDNVILLDYDPVKYNYYVSFGGARQRREELHGVRHGRRRHGGGPLVDHKGRAAGPSRQLGVQMRIHPQNTPPRYRAPRAATHR